MACEYLLDGTHPLCLVVQGLMAPSLSEMRAYCTTDYPFRCPLYQQRAATQEDVPLDAAVMLLGPRAGTLVRKAALRKASLPVENSTSSGPIPPRRQGYAR
jgi:hypothetical protein